MNALELIKLIWAAETPDQIREADRAASAFLKDPAADPTDVDVVRRAKSDVLARRLDDIEYEQQEALRYLALNGKQYNLEDWLTPVEYARRYGLRSANNVTNWMIRGIIPPADILDVPELNGLRLIRNRIYKEDWPPIRHSTE